MNEIVNPAYLKWSNAGSIEQSEFMGKLSLNDSIIYRDPNNYPSINENKVTMITYRGVNVHTGCGDTFVKWRYIKALRKKADFRMETIRLKIKNDPKEMKALKDLSEVHKEGVTYSILDGPHNTICVICGSEMMFDEGGLLRCTICDRIGVYK